MTLPEGWSPIWERTPADKAYVILSGTVSVRHKGTEIAQLGEGDIMGEAALMNHSLRTASVVALTPWSSSTSPTTRSRGCVWRCRSSPTRSSPWRASASATSPDPRTP